MNYEKHEKIIYRNESYKIQDSMFEVYKILGHGFPEAVSEISNIHKAQLLNYLKAVGLKLGLLVNFSSYPKVEIERIVL